MPNRRASPAFRTHIQIDPDIYAEMQVLMHSPIEGRIPYGQMGAFVNEALRFRLRTASLDLAPYTGEMPGTWVVRGDAGAVEKLRELLAGEAVKPSQG